MMQGILPMPQVYPRVCGGTRNHHCYLRFGMGLSPRMRGNRTMRRARLCRTRSIPAYAGEPGSSAVPTPPSTVYPRVCGGTRRSGFPSRPARGLSPRMRGNPMQCEDGGFIGRSIPAYAGEPTLWHGYSHSSRVYPRVCGGTNCRRTGCPVDMGLSPRMRGNHSQQSGEPVAVGSIPAYAGEPDASVCGCPQNRVYPRVCGGTAHQSGNAGAGRGLSPRMRGNRRYYRHADG